MLRDLPNKRLPVRLRHPVSRLDLLIGPDHGVEIALQVGLSAARLIPHCRGSKLCFGLRDLVKQSADPRLVGRGKLVAIHPLSVTAQPYRSQAVS